MNPYDFDYFERGIETNKSMYQNYRWIPELTIPMAMTIIDFLKIQRNATILDFGCSKGFLVKAFRLLHRMAWGVDCSEYALENAHPDVIHYCKPSWEYSTFPKPFDFCIAKDVLEHIELPELCEILERIPAVVLFVVVPLSADGEKYNAPANDFDVTHKIRKGLFEWAGLIEQCGWKVQDERTRIPGIKDSYERYRNGHGFITAFRSNQT